MTTKPQQRSVAVVGAIREAINGTIDTLIGSLSAQSEQLEQAFMAELAHLDELYTDQENDDTALELVQRFDKGYAKTMASIQAATERLIEARAHIARITNTIEFHPAFTGNGYGEGKLGRPDLAPVVYKLGPITSDKHYPVSWVAIQDLINGHWPFSEQDRLWATGKTIILSSYWQCPASKIDARVIVNLSLDNNGNWAFEITEMTAKVDGKKIDYHPVETEVDDKILLSISPYDCFATEATTKENDHE